MRSRNSYSEIIPIVRSHVSTNRGHLVTGNFVRLSPNACPPAHSLDQPGPALWTVLSSVGDYRPDVTKNLAKWVKRLLDAGADPNQKGYDGTTALHVAVMLKHAGVVKLLMKAGGDPSIEDDTGESPATCAEDDEGIARLLVRKGKLAKKPARQTGLKKRSAR